MIYMDIFWRIPTEIVKKVRKHPRRHEEYPKKNSLRNAWWMLEAKTFYKLIYLRNLWWKFFCKNCCTYTWRSISSHIWRNSWKYSLTLSWRNLWKNIKFYSSRNFLEDSQRILWRNYSENFLFWGISCSIGISEVNNWSNSYRNSWRMFIEKPL